MTTDLQVFWTNRFLAHGHTGWADPVIYAYDQLERLTLIQTVLAANPVKNGVALDFGCGTGDFSRLLVNMGFTVCGYDPFVKPKIKSSRFAYVSTYQQIPFEPQTVDLVLAVTTLSHILKEDDIRDALRVIRKYAKPNGDVYMLEYALDDASDRQRYGLDSDYQAFRTVSEWQRLLKLGELQLIRIDPFPQPVTSPSSGFLDYKKTLLARIGWRYASVQVAKPVLALLLRWFAARFVQPKPKMANPDGSSPLKLIHCSIDQRQS